MLAHDMQAHGFTPHVIGDGALALAAVERIQPEAILLDVVLPHVDGIEICGQLRRISVAPIIIISARVEEYRVFRLLLTHPGQVLLRERLLDAAHGDGSGDTADRAIDSHIKNLRRKVRAAGTRNKLIVSVYGAGYRFEAPL